MTKFVGTAGTKYSDQIQKIVAQMTDEEKVGQLIQPSKSFLKEGEMQSMKFGTILSGGGEGPTYEGVMIDNNNLHKKNNGPQDWYNMVEGYLKQYETQRMKIPILYGVDGVHGHNTVTGATVFPHNISLGCANDVSLMERIGRATAIEMKATGILWNFAPFVSIPEDFRWGRSYEGLSQNVEQTSRLGVAYTKGVQSPLDSSSNHPMVAATTKHFIGDGLWEWGTGVSPDPVFDKENNFKIDEGDFEMSFEELYMTHAQPHKAQIDNGVLSVMISYGRFNKESVSISDTIINKLLRQKLGFKGVVVSDWETVNRARPKISLKEAVKKSFLAGMDVYMIGPTYREYYQSLLELVKEGVISQERLDLSVARVLELKFILNLFEDPLPKPNLLPRVFCSDHQQLAIEAVEKSSVLLKNENKTLPLQLSQGKPKTILVGEQADSLGFLCGGWTITWKGGLDAPLPGVSIKKGLENAFKEQGVSFEYSKRASSVSGSKQYDVAIVVVGEDCYVEGLGDNPRPSLTEQDIEQVENAQKIASKVVTIVVSGRPIELNYQRVVLQSDALVAPFLPGNLGGIGLSNLLLGKSKFQGKLGFMWPKTYQNYKGQKKVSAGDILYDYNHGLIY